jgi:hypothetical protein
MAKMIKVLEKGGTYLYVDAEKIESVVVYTNKYTEVKDTVTIRMDSGSEYDVDFSNELVESMGIVA